MGQVYQGIGLGGQISGRDGYTRGEYNLVYPPHPLVLTSSGGHRSGRYAPYLNTFLIHYIKTFTLTEYSAVRDKDDIFWNYLIAMLHRSMQLLGVQIL